MNQPPQQTIEMQLSVQSEAALRNCLGKSFLDIWAPSLDISPEVEGVAFAPSFSIPYMNPIPLSGWSGFLTFQVGKWGDTKEFCLDCFEIVAEERKLPLGLEDKYKEKSISGHSSIHFWGDTSPVQKIEIREIEEAYTLESVSEVVKYDHSLYFERGSGQKVIIATGDASHSLCIAWSDSAIDKILNKTTLRMDLRA